jgi:uncharacterized protein (TIGR01244 family)
VELVRRYERAIAGSYRKSRHTIGRISPKWIRRSFGPILEWFDLYAIDHGIFRSIYSNTHQVTPHLWRSSQPAPYQIRRLARKGIRTIINMRGERDCGSYRLEASACARYGVKLINFPLLRSRMAPSKEGIRQAKELLEQIEYPALVHCKSGADRAGLLCGLYLVFQEGAPIEQAMHQLDVRYGHIKQAHTGVLDCFFERYIAYNNAAPIPFLAWVETAYDPLELKKTFRARSWAIIAVDWILRRE